MSTRQPEDLDEEFISAIDPLIEHSRVVHDRKEEIHEVFEREFASKNDVETNFEELFMKIDLVFAAELDRESREELAEALVNGVTSLGRKEEKELREDHNENEIAEILRTLKRRYQPDLRRRIRRHYQGINWWSNIKTEPKFRGGQPGFSHEITIDDRKITEIDSSLSNTVLMSMHFINQVKSAQKTHGEDAFENLDPQVIRDLRKDVEDTLEKVEDYHNVPEEKEENGNNEESRSEE